MSISLSLLRDFVCRRPRFGALARAATKDGGLELHQSSRRVLVIACTCRAWLWALDDGFVSMNVKGLHLPNARPPQVNCSDLERSGRTSSLRKYLSPRLIATLALTVVQPRPFYAVSRSRQRRSPAPSSKARLTSYRPQARTSPMHLARNDKATLTSRSLTPKHSWWHVLRLVRDSALRTCRSSMFVCGAPIHLQLYVTAIWSNSLSCFAYRDESRALLPTSTHTW